MANKKINRRSFFKKAGLTTLGAGAVFYGPNGLSFFVKIKIPRCGRRPPLHWDKFLTRKPRKVLLDLLTTVIPGCGRLRVKHRSPPAEK